MCLLISSAGWLIHSQLIPSYSSQKSLKTFTTKRYKSIFTSKNYFFLLETFYFLFLPKPCCSVILSLNLEFSCHVQWPITATEIAKRKTINKKILQIKKYCSHIRKICFHISKICSHIQKRICLQIQTVNSHGKFLRQILAANSHGKFSRQIPTANSRICKAKDCVEYPLWERASHVKIKRNK